MRPRIWVHIYGQYRATKNVWGGILECERSRGLRVNHAAVGWACSVRTLGGLVREQHRKDYCTVHRASSWPNDERRRVGEDQGAGGGCGMCFSRFEKGAHVRRVRTRKEHMPTDIVDVK